MAFSFARFGGDKIEIVPKNKFHLSTRRTGESIHPTTFTPMGSCCSDSASDSEQTSLLASKNEPAFFDPRSPDPLVHRTPLLTQPRRGVLGGGPGGRGEAGGARSAFQKVNQNDSSHTAANMYGSLPKNAKLKGQSH